MQILAKIAFERKITFVFNMSAKFVFQFYMDSVKSIFPYVNIIVGNDEVSIVYMQLKSNN